MYEAQPTQNAEMQPGSSREERRAFQRRQEGARGWRAQGEHRERVTKGASVHMLYPVASMADHASS